MTIETPSKSASTKNGLAARQWVDAFNARDDEGEATREPPPTPGTLSTPCTCPRSTTSRSAGWSTESREHWFQMDTLTMFEQLGLRVMPGP